MDVIYAVHAEFAVLMEHLQSSGFLEFGMSNSDVVSSHKASTPIFLSFQFDLASKLFYSWLCFNTVSNTARNGGHATKFLYFVDESYLPVNEEAIELFHRSSTEIRDPYVPSRSEVSTSTR